MREIKFRAWNRIENTMYYTHYIYSFHLHEFAKLKEFFGILDDVKDQFTDPMQYTGLKDKNGKEIYEGDIVNKNMPTEVIYQKGSYCIWYQGYLFALNERLTESEIEVIGNKYENPELMEKINGMDECDSNCV